MKAGNDPVTGKSPPMVTLIVAVFSRLVLFSLPSSTCAGNDAVRNIIILANKLFFISGFPFTYKC